MLAKKISYPGECPSDRPNCQVRCSREYQPVCGYSVGQCMAKSFSNSCMMMTENCSQSNANRKDLWKLFFLRMLTNLFIFQNFTFCTMENVKHFI